MRPANLDQDRPADAPCLGLRILWLELCGAPPFGDLRPHALGVADYALVLDQGRQLGCRAVQFVGEDAVRHAGLPRLIAHARGIGFEHLEVCADPAPLPQALLRCFAAHGAAVLLTLPAGARETAEPPAPHARMLRLLAAAGVAARIGPRPVLEEWMTPGGGAGLRPVGTVADASLSAG
ncbi:MAG: hypothetical protein JSR21_11170 [Proteobacteria bacterium]|nr:hypothetical protein [Pseudomonadota bacterium]